MKLLFLAPTLDETNGWGRYASGFLAHAKAALGEENVIAPEPDTLRSRVVRWKTPFLAVMDRRHLLAKAASCDLIHATAESLAPLAMLLSGATGKPYVVSAHGTYADLMTYRWYVRWLYRKAFEDACAIVPVSRFTENFVRRQFPNARTAIVPGGFDMPTGGATKKTHEGFRILAVGALKPRKGYHILIDAFRMLEGGASLDIVGREDLMPTYAASLKARIVEKGLEDTVTLHGRLPQERLDALYASADLFVLPSEHDGMAFEGLGLVYLEALACGVPVIGCFESGAEDVIEDGVNGFLVKPGDVEGLAKTIGRLYDDRTLLAEMASRSVRTVDAFRWNTVGKKMQELYASCLA